MCISIPSSSLCDEKWSFCALWNKVGFIGLLCKHWLDAFGLLHCFLDNFLPCIHPVERFELKTKWGLTWSATQDSASRSIPWNYLHQSFCKKKVALGICASKMCQVQYPVSPGREYWCQSKISISYIWQKKYI